MMFNEEFSSQFSLAESVFEDRGESQKVSSPTPLEPLNELSPLGHSTPICSDSEEDSENDKYVSRNPLFTDEWADMLYGPVCVRHRRGEPKKQWLAYCGSRKPKPPATVVGKDGITFPFLEKSELPRYRNLLMGIELPTHIRHKLEKAFRESLAARAPDMDHDLPGEPIDFSQFVSPPPSVHSPVFLPSSPVLPEKRDNVGFGEYQNDQTVIAADGSFNPNYTCDFCYGKVLRDCQKAGEGAPPRAGRGIWYGHRLRDAVGNVTCPRLYSMSCHGCGATGQKAHTISHCPINRMASTQMVFPPMQQQIVSY